MTPTSGLFTETESLEKLLHPFSNSTGVWGYIKSFMR